MTHLLRFSLNARNSQIIIKTFYLKYRDIYYFVSSINISDISALFTHARMKSSPVKLPTITSRPSPRNGAIEWYVRAVRRGFRWRR